MNNIYINGNEYEYKTDWNELTIKDISIINKLKDLDDKIREISLINHFSNIPMSVLYNLKIEDINKLAENFNWLNTLPELEKNNDFIYENRKWHCLHPFENETIMKWIMLDNLILKDEEITKKLNEYDYEAISLLMACTLHEVPQPGIKSKYDIYDAAHIEEKKEIFKNIPLLLGLSYVNFFFGLLKNYETTSTTFSEERIKVLMYLVQNSKTSTIMDGNMKSTNLQEEILPNEQKSYKKPYQKSSGSSRSRRLK